MYQHPARIKKIKREEGRKLLDEASKGRGVRQDISSNQKNTINTNYTHKQLNCFYTNADSPINKCNEFKTRVESHKCMVITIT